MAISPTSAAKHFIEKCKKNIIDVATYVQQKLQDPASLVDFEASGALVDAVQGNLGPLKNYAENYITNNAQALTIAVLEGVGEATGALAGLNNFFNALSSAVAVFNDLLLLMTKQTARSVIENLDAKTEIRTDLLNKLDAYVNTLELMRAGPSVFDEYVNQLREALLKVHLADRDLKTVRSTFDATDQFLDLRFTAAKTNLEEADKLIKPKDNPYLNPNVRRGVLQTRQSTSTELTTPELGEVRVVREGNTGRVQGALADRFFERTGVFTEVLPGDLLDTDAVVREETAIVDGEEVTTEEVLAPAGVRTVLQVPDDYILRVEPDFVLTLPEVQPFTYRIYRKDGLDGDGITLYDRRGKFETNGPMEGHFVKFHVPDYKTIKIARVVSEHELKLVAPPENFEGKNVEDVSYEIKINTGVPTDEDQFANIMAIPAMTNQIVLSGKGYFSSTFKANTGLDLFRAALDALLDTVPSIMKRYVLNILQEATNSTTNLKENMATHLNGSPNRVTGPVGNFSPSAVNVSAFSFKWDADINLILGLLGFVPEEALTNITLSQQPVNAYRNAVERLERVDTYSTGTATVIGEDGKEELNQLESQLFLLLIEGNTLIFSGDMREEIIALGRSIIRNLELAQARDDDVKAILQAWIDFPIPAETELLEMLAGIRKLLDDLGLDKAIAHFADGDWESLLNLQSGRSATYVGAALIALALLQDCFGSQEEKDELNKITNELQKEQQLLNIRFSIDFNFLIFKKLEECTRFENLATNLNLKEILCGLLKEAGAGDLLDSIGNALDSGMGQPGEQTATSTIAETR